MLAVGAFASAGAIGVGIAASLPALVIAAAVVAVVYIIQFNEDQSILPMLQEALTKAYATPDVWTIAATDLGRVELFSTFVYQTLPSYDEQRLASVVPAPPGQRQPGDPRFEVNGVVQDVIQTWGPAGKLQQTFMSQGWFVTRTQQGGTWGPWQWALTLRYRGPNLSDQGTHTAGIQPAGFFHTYQASTLQVTAATKVTQLQTLNATLEAETVKWTGNRPPKLVPTVSEEPRIGSPVVFSAGASDPDGNPITAIRWFFEDPTINVLRPSFAECSLAPPGQIDPVSGLAYSCPWAAINDSGTGVGYTYATPGTWSVLVMAEDSEGAVSSERFSVTLGNLAPTLTVTNLPFLVLPPAVASTPEGQALSVSGTVNYPALPDGAYGALTTLFIEWGDGQVTTWMYPCNAENQPYAPSDASCGFRVATADAYIPYPGQTLTPGPWSFNFSHVYAYGQGGLANPAQVKIYAVTTLDAWSQVERVNFTITNVPPVVEMRPVCSIVPLGGGLLCLAGDFREVAVGAPLTINGRIFDVPEAQHFVKVIWGDGTSSILANGCTSSGCPGTVGVWPFATPPTSSYTPKYFSLSHAYQAVGTYPISLVVDDGGPGGKVSYSSQATIFGVSPLSGPAEVAAGSPATYTYTSVVPAGATATITPTCEGGQVTGQTTSSFTCVFADVTAKTASHVKLQATILTNTFERSLDVNVLTRPTIVSAITGPPTVTAGTTATYTYTATYSSLALVFDQPTCGIYANVISGASGSITCQFKDVDNQVTTDVGITVSALGGSASSSKAVTVLPDVTPPVLTLPGTIKVNSASNAGANVNFTVTAVDAVSGPSQLITCSAFSGQLFPIGTTNVKCSAGDWTGNVAVDGFAVVVTDVTAPSLVLPAPLTLNATAPNGAVATFVASAVDAIPLAPTVTCQPASGSTFAIGTTNVACSAKDAAGNLTSGTFPITVIGAADQIATLQRWVEKLTIDATLQRQLVSALKKAGAAAASGDSQTACKQLATVVSLVNDAGNKLTKGQFNKILNDVGWIRAVVGC